MLTNARLIQLILALLIGMACNKQSGNDVFKINSYSIAINGSVKSTIYYKGNFYCLTDSGKFVCLSEGFEINRPLTDSINQRQFDYFYLGNDTLIAGNYSEDTTAKNLFLDNNLKWKRLTRNQYGGGVIYEDDLYTVESCCVGEFGGAAFFKDKRTKRVFSCPATCATAVNKFNNSYYLTNSLNHLSGFSEFLKIDDPSKLYELTADSLKNHCNWWMSLIPEEDHSDRKKYTKSKARFETGTQKIFDTIGVISLTSFIYNDKLYHVNYDMQKAFISTLQENTLITLDTITNKSLWSYNGYNRKYGEMQLFSFSNDETSGFLVARNNTVSLILFK